MAICHEMKEGDVFFCELCGLELKVEKSCSCGTGEDACTVPLQCCGQDMTKKQWKSWIPMILYRNHTAMKAEDEISSAFSLCNPQGLLAWDKRHLRYRLPLEREQGLDHGICLKIL